MGRGSDVAMSCGVGHRCGSDPVLLWLCCRLAAVALNLPQAWELPGVAGVALKSKTITTKMKKKKKPAVQVPGETGQKAWPYPRGVRRTDPKNGAGLGGRVQRGLPSRLDSWTSGRTGGRGLLAPAPRVLEG